jgi:hypothetical protein
MQLGDPDTAEGAERSRLDAVLDKLNDVYAELLDTIETGGLEQLNAAEKISFWRRFETFRNRLPLIDHGLIADAEASDLAGEYSFSNLARFWCGCSSCHLPKPAPGSGLMLRWDPEPRRSGSGWSRCCRNWPLCNATARSPPRRCRLWSGAMHLLSRPGLRVEDVETAEQLLSDYASASDTSNTTPRSTRAPKGQQRDYCGLADIRQAVGPGWRGLRTDRQYADQPD